ncbi:sodium:solute symporter family protein [Phaeodactylibacter luteus]|uniref:Na+:solute symporter n=1 Tax=Phaeodactylibacter luteus TaxID=1564516 RepID=A0A5C6RJE2_9BACT|nr:sodium:solute symporter family protein [Phaeodactylibacter luteus]TXB62055.1 Na+:solute symporter [Phaeodactylibacter luteus]
MNLSILDISIIFGYLVLTILFGFWVSRRASKDMQAYFLGGNQIKWYLLGLSNASGMFDISGTMWTVTILFVYGLKSAWIPWLWPVWNQVFVMVFLALWLRRSGVLTGAQWITFRFGDKAGGRLSHIIVTVFAIISVFGFIAYFFEGIGKFAIIFFPWDLSADLGFMALTSAQSYALIIIAITTLYTIKGGMYSVVGTEVLQFVIMSISCAVVGFIAYTSVSQEQIAAAVPPGWDELFFGWEMGLDWTGYLDSVNQRIAEDGFGAIGLLLIAMIFKGIFASLAGPVPSYDMQRVLSTRTPAEAARMSGLTILVLYFPRYLMIAGFAVLALVYLTPEFEAMGADIDFETVLPLAIDRFVPSGFQGLLLAGLLAAFMGTFAAFINAAPAYLVNDLYKKYINPEAPQRTYIRYSYLASFALVAIGLIGGFFAQSINALTLWITSALYGGYAAANALKWVWWRFNGYGYFWGMIGGLLGATFIPPLFPDVVAIYLFPVIFAISVAGCLLGTFLTPAEPDEVLMHFYKKTNPWGFWAPIREKVLAADPGFEPNQDFKRDAFNVLVGIIWQMTLVVMPMYLLIKQSAELGVAFLIFLLTSWLLKKYWWDPLKD